MKQPIPLYLEHFEPLAERLQLDDGGDAVYVLNSQEGLRYTLRTGDWIRVRITSPNQMTPALPIILDLLRGSLRSELRRRFS
jgi:hypothetical protein